MKFDRPLIIIVYLILLCVSGQAAIQISGNHRFSDDELRQHITSSMPDDSIASCLETFYEKSGYFNMHVEKIGHLANGDREVILYEGKPSIVAVVSIIVTPPDSTIAFDDLALEYTNKPATEYNFNYLAERCIDRMAQMGHPFASGQWQEFKFDSSGAIRTTFRILPGPRSFIAGAIFEGAKRTKRKNLVRFLTFRPGQQYSELKIDESGKSIDRMPYADLAAPFEIRPFFDGDSCYIVYNIRELPSTKFDGAGGLVAVAGKETVVGRLDLEFGDILGTGRAFNLKWNKKDKWSSELSVGYLEPFLLQSDFDLRLEISQRDLDSSFIKSSGQIGFVRSFHSGLSGHLWLGAERTVPEPHSDLVRSNSRFVGLEFDYDKTDDPLNPKSGYGLSSSVEHKNRTNSISDSIAPDLPHKITTADMKARYFGKISRRAVLAIQGRAGGVVSSDGIVPRDEFFYLGGFDNLRGYAEKRFPAYRYFMVSLEPRLLTGDVSRIYTFVDIAQIKGSQNQSSEYNFYPGYGVGVMAPSAIGQFKLEIGWGKTGFPDDGVVNFGLAGQF